MDQTLPKIKIYTHYQVLTSIRETQMIMITKLLQLQICQPSACLQGACQFHKRGNFCNPDTPIKRLALLHLCLDIGEATNQTGQANNLLESLVIIQKQVLKMMKMRKLLIRILILAQMKVKTSLAHVIKYLKIKISVLNVLKIKKKTMILLPQYHLTLTLPQLKCSQVDMIHKTYRGANGF